MRNQLGHPEFSSGHPSPISALRRTLQPTTLLRRRAQTDVTTALHGLSPVDAAKLSVSLCSSATMTTTPLRSLHSTSMTTQSQSHRPLARRRTNHDVSRWQPNQRCQAQPRHGALPLERAQIDAASSRRHRSVEPPRNPCPIDRSSLAQRPRQRRRPPLTSATIRCTTDPVSVLDPVSRSLTRSMSATRPESGLGLLNRPASSSGHSLHSFDFPI